MYVGRQLLAAEAFPLGVDIIVGAMTNPVQLRLEPSQVRARDDGRAAYRVVLDNRRSNVPMTFEFAGRDDEEQVRFDFEPALVELGGAVLLLFAVIMVAGLVVIERGFPRLGIGYDVVLGACVLAFVGSNFSRE